MPSTARNKVKLLRSFFIVTVFSVFFSCSLHAQVSVNVPGYSVRVDGHGGTTVNSGSGIVGSDVQIEGVTIINDKLFIDGVKVPRGITVYTSKKTKKTYKIQWGKNGNIRVSEK